MKNERASDMAEIVLDHYDFKGKGVVDFGCGYGDMLCNALAAGAKHALGFDIDPGPLQYAATKCCGFDNVDFAVRKIEELVDEDEVRGDVAFCFSVLPYIKYPGLFVKWMGDRFPVVFIECQYFGDGPGNIAKDDESMSRWLREWGFDMVMLCGQTHVVGRDMYRSVWKCYRLEI